MHLLTSAAAASSWLAAEGGGAEDATMSNPIIPHWPEFWWSLVVFGVLWFAIAKYVAPGLEKTYAERAAAIQGGMEKAEKAQAEANAVKAKYEAELADARTEAARIRSEAREQGSAIVAEMRHQAQDESARILDSAARQLESERSQVLYQLRGEVGVMSTDLASRIVGESLQNETRQRGIVERFLAELEAGDLKAQKVDS